MSSVGENLFNLYCETLVAVQPSTGTLLCKSLNWCISKGGTGELSAFPHNIFYTLRQVKGDEQQDVLPFQIQAGAGERRPLE